jgi:hypothetical protein
VLEKQRILVYPLLRGIFMKKLIAFFFVVIAIVNLSAHPGRTDSNGGHNGPNGYHYHNSTAPSTSSSESAGEQDFLKFYDENRDKDLFENAGSRSREIQNYERIESNSLKINMLFTFHDEKVAAERGEAIGRDCLNIMFKWLERNHFNIPASRGALYCFILGPARKEFWLIILDEKTGEVVTVKRN